MGILLDVGFGIILVLCVIFGYRRGFFKSFAGFIGAVAAMLLAWTFAGLLANGLYQWVFRGMLVNSISDAIAQSGMSSLPEQAGTVTAILPGFLSSILSRRGITGEQIQQALQSAGGNAAEKTADLISPAIIWLLQLSLTIILFCVLLIVVRFLVNAIGKVLHFPVLRQLNGIMGGVFGILKGIVYLFLACVVLQLIMAVIGNSVVPMQQMLDQSYVYQFLFGYNPMTSWFV